MAIFEKPPSDADFDDLVSEEKITERRKEADETFKDISESMYQNIRRRMKNDLFFLMGMLGNDLISPNLHGHLCRWLAGNRGTQWKMILLPRNHYKSTTLTVSDSVQMALPNVAGLQDYPYTLGPNVKILIGHEVREKASSFLFKIAKAFTSSPSLLFFFPECVPSKRIHRVNKWELELPRDEHHEVATFSTIGAGSAAQGGHYNWLKLDDLVGEEARDSETVMKTILTWFDNVNSLLTRPMLDGWDLIGTRWAFSDVYSHAMTRYGIDIEGSFIRCIPDKEVEKHKDGSLRVYARGMIEDGELIFPEENTWKFVNILRKNPIVWASQYANNPIESGLNSFSWPLKFYNVDLRNNITVFTGDESIPSLRLNPSRDLDICVFCDPSMGESSAADPTGIVVTGVDQKNNIFLLETVSKRLKPPELVDELYRLHFKYRPRVIAIEEVNFSAIYRYWIEDKADRTRTYLPIHPYKPGSKRSKAKRILALAHFFASGQVYIAEAMHAFRDEYEQYPLGNHEHLLDALAQGPDFWEKGVNRGRIEEQERYMENYLEERSVTTGY